MHQIKFMEIMNKTYFREIGLKPFYLTTVM